MHPLPRHAVLAFALSAAVACAGGASPPPESATSAPPARSEAKQREAARAGDDSTHHEDTHAESADAHGEHGAHAEHGHGEHGHAEHGAPRGEHPAQGGSHGYAMDFSAADRFATHFDDPERDAWQKPDEVVRLMNVRPGQVVVDLGAGTGYFVRHLSKAVGPSGRVLALDAEPNMVSHLADRGRKEGWKNVEARAVPPDDPRLAAGSVDRVLVVNTWHHISDRERYAGKLAASLKAGGSIFIVDFTMDSPTGPPPGHRLPADRVLRELEQGGLKARLADESLPHQYVVVGSR